MSHQHEALARIDRNARVTEVDLPRRGAEAGAGKPPARTVRRSTIVSLLALVWSQTDRSLRMRVVGSMLLTAGVASLSVTAPLIYKAIVDVLSAGAAAGPLTFPLKLVAAYLVIFVMLRVCVELRWVVYGGFEQGVQQKLLLHLFDHVHSLSLRFHLERKTGGLQQIIFNGLQGYRFIVSNVVLVALPLVLSILFIGAILAIYYPIPFVLVMVLMCILFTSSLVLGVEHQRASQRVGNRAYEDASARTADSYLNYETIKLFDGEEIIRHGLNGAISRGQLSFARFYLQRTLTGFAQSLWLVVWLATTVTLAATYVIHGVMSIGDFVLVIAYTLQLWMPLEYLSVSYREIRMGQTNVESMLALLDERPEVEEPAHPAALPPEQGELRFENVGFFYESGRQVLNGLSFGILAGRTVAIVGQSGAGKSTIARLIFRFYDVCSGRIVINGVPIETCALKSLRSAISVVPQDAVLLNDTIACNIGIARAGCSQSDIEHAARLAEMHDFIVSLPDGYQTVVGERGLKLSGGQKQRVAIARAILKRAGILIFDEATSALDAGIEQAIYRNLRKELGDVTKLIITHRLSTIVDADEIVLLSEGRIVERGGHDELLKLDGLYADMWRHQLAEKAA